MLLSLANGAVPPLGSTKLSLPTATPSTVKSSTSKNVTAPPSHSTTPTTGATDSTHSGCYAYFNAHGGCVARTSSNNCPPKKTSIQVEQLTTDDAALPTGNIATGGVMPPAVGATPPTGTTPPPTHVKLHRRSASMFRRSDEDAERTLEPTVLAAVQPPGSKTLSTGPPLASTDANNSSTGTTVKTPVVDTPAGSPPGDSSSYLSDSSVTIPADLPGNSSTSPAKTPGGSVTAPVEIPGGSVTSPGKLPESPVTAPGKTSAGTVPPPSVTPVTTPVSSGSSKTIDGICGPYNTETDLGVCLWSGSDTEGKDISKSGWLSSAITTNCGKEVAVLKAGLSKPVVLKVIDGCNFATPKPEVGCSQIFLTKKAFKALGPTAKEEADGFFTDHLVWDFLAVTNSSNVPV